MRRKAPIRLAQPPGSFSQGISCRNTRTVFIADGLRPAKLGIDDDGVESLGIPHLDLVDGAGGNIIDADHPGFLEYQRLAASGSILRFGGERGKGEQEAGGETKRFIGL